MTVNVGAPFPNIKSDAARHALPEERGGQNFVGDSSAFATTIADTCASIRRACVSSRDGNFFVSDEYGPVSLRVQSSGPSDPAIPVPEKFLIANPSGRAWITTGNSLELYPDHNTSGRQANRGMEGLAITPDGRTLVGHDAERAHPGPRAQRQRRRPAASA